MRETYVVSFEKNTVTQARLVKAESTEQARAYFAEIEPTATVYGVTVDNVGYARRGMPCEVVPDGWTEQPAQEAQEDQEEGNTMEENRLYCKRVADELEAYDTGSVWKCPECSETVENADATSYAPAVCECGEEMEQLGLYDWLADTLDVEYTVDSSLDYKAAKVYVTLGGPTVWVDTSEHAVKLAWGTDREEYPLDWDVCNHLDEALEDEYNARRG